MSIPLGEPPAWMVAALRRRIGLPLHECRRVLVAATLAEYKRIGGEASGHYPCDPAEDNPALATILLRATLEVEAELAGENGQETGFCHRRWRTKQRILQERYGVEWLRPDQLSNIVFD